MLKFVPLFALALLAGCLDSAPREVAVSAESVAIHWPALTDAQGRVRAGALGLDIPKVLQHRPDSYSKAADRAPSVFLTLPLTVEIEGISHAFTTVTVSRDTALDAQALKDLVAVQVRSRDLVSMGQAFELERLSPPPCPPSDDMAPAECRDRASRALYVSAEGDKPVFVNCLQLAPTCLLAFDLQGRQVSMSIGQLDVYRWQDLVAQTRAILESNVLLKPVKPVA